MNIHNSIWEEEFFSEKIEILAIPTNPTFLLSWESLGQEIFQSYSNLEFIFMEKWAMGKDEKTIGMKRLRKGFARILI